MDLWIAISTVIVNILFIIAAAVTIFLKMGRWEQKMNDTCDSIEEIKGTLSDQAKTLNEHGGRISYLEGLSNGKH